MKASESPATTWRLFVGARNPGARNMALDETLAAQVSGGGLPALRLYRFEPPAITVGRFQDIRGTIDERACARLGVDIARRPTGGLAILHLHDFTYSVAIPRSDGGTRLGGAFAFRLISGCVLRALESLGISATEVEHHRGRGEHTPWCLDSEFGVDLEYESRKICGSAQRVYERAILQHGSLFLSDNSALMARLTYAGSKDRRFGPFATLGDAAGIKVEWEQVAQAFIEGFESRLQVDFVETEEEALS